MRNRKRRSEDLPSSPEERRRATRELDQRTILDLYARHRDHGRVATELALDADALQRALDRLGLQRRVHALLRGELVRYPPLRPHGVAARPSTPIRRRPLEKAAALEPAPSAPDPDRARILVLVERARGLRRRAAEWLGVTPEELDQRIDALGIRVEVNRIRASARRAALKDAPLATRLRQVLSRATDLDDLGILWKIDREVRAEVEKVWRDVCANVPSARAAQVALADALAISGEQARRLVARYQLAFEK